MASIFDRLFGSNQKQMHRMEHNELEEYIIGILADMKRLNAKYNAMLREVRKENPLSPADALAKVRMMAEADAINPEDVREIFAEMGESVAQREASEVTE